MNFPLGDRFPLEPQPFRWDVPLYLIAMIIAAREEISGVGAGSKAGGDSRQLHALGQVLKAGLDDHHVGIKPHLVLNDRDWYRKHVAPLLADMITTWLRAKQTFASGELSDAAIRSYLLNGVQAPADVLSSVGAIAAAAIQALNLCHSWLTSYLPHVLSKVVRVSFGLLQPDDLRALSVLGEQPLSRKLLAVPFVGKDLPSHAAEFAQPDILIGMAVLAYRYEGLRLSDVRQIIYQLKAEQQSESGPRQQRSAYKRFDDWIRSTCELKGMHRRVFDLEMFQLADEDQVTSAFNLLHDQPDVIRHYLENHVFRQTMWQQLQKIPASGQEIGGDILFGRRLGFSGTPSDLLPFSLGKCSFEAEAEAKILESLTNGRVTMEATVQCDATWTIKGLLDQIAASTQPPFHCLIDTGALITGITNEGVARYLLAHGLRHVDGCVFLDRDDAKMILLRGAPNAIPLSECGISSDARFTFYDQVHTTGMDIPQTSNAAALLTLSKDMTYRDYAQGAYRMRGITKGQTIHLLATPEVRRFLSDTASTLAGRITSKKMEVVSAAWLLLNGIRAEKLQFLQLSQQNIASTWRTTALDTLVRAAEAQHALDPANLGSVLFEGAGAEDARACLDALIETVNLDVPHAVPRAQSFTEELQAMVMEHETLVSAGEQKQIQALLLRQVERTLDPSGADQERGGLEAEVTKEKEREQEQQKEKQQLREEINLFAPSDCAATPWHVSVLDARKWDEAQAPEPFYMLRDFSPRRHKLTYTSAGQSKTIYPVKPIAFPRTLLQTTNFAPFDWAPDKPLRLKNVTFVLEWFPRPADAQTHRRIIVSLAEAEALRKLIHQRRRSTASKGVRTDGTEAALALVLLPANVVLDATHNFPRQDSGAQMHAWSVVHFWNAELFYTKAQRESLLEELSQVDKRGRRAFFEASMLARRRTRTSWSDTPIRWCFVFDNREAACALFERANRLRQLMHKAGMDLETACKTIDASGDGYLSRSEIYDAMHQLDPSVTLSFVDELILVMDIDNDAMIMYADFHAFFESEDMVGLESLISSGGVPPTQATVPMLSRSFSSFSSASELSIKLPATSRAAEARKRREEFEELQDVEDERVLLELDAQPMDEMDEMDAWTQIAKEVRQLVTLVHSAAIDRVQVDTQVKFSTDSCHLAYMHAGRDLGRACAWLLSVAADSEALIKGGDGVDEAVVWKLQKIKSPAAEAAALIALSRSELQNKCWERSLPCAHCRESMEFVWLLTAGTAGAAAQTTSKKSNKLLILGNDSRTKKGDQRPSKASSMMHAFVGRAKAPKSVKL